MKPSPRNRRVQEILTPEEWEARQKEAEEFLEKMTAEMRKAEEEDKKERARVHDILEQLQIPHDSNNNVDGKALADILMDETKVKAILTRIRCVAFWW